MNEVDLYGHVYDYYSIMHYDGTAFGRFDRKSKKRLVTMIPIKVRYRLSVKLRNSFHSTTEFFYDGKTGNAKI